MDDIRPRPDMIVSAAEPRHPFAAFPPKSRHPEGPKRVGSFTVDTQREEFYGRVARLERDRSATGGHGRRPGIGGGNWVLPVIMVLFALVATKAVVHARIGAESYEYRIALLASGDGADRIGAWVLAPGSVTRGLSEALRAVAN